MIYSEFTEICERRKVTQGAIVKGELVAGIMVEAKTEPLDERKQTELIRVFEWSGPQILLARVWPAIGVVVGREGVVKMGHGSDVPRKTCRRTREKDVGVVDEVGDDHIHEFLWEPGGLGRTCGGSPQDGGQLLDFYPVSVPNLVSAPELVSKECDHYGGVTTTHSLTGIRLMSSPVGEDVSVFMVWGQECDRAPKSKLPSSLSPSGWRSNTRSRGQITTIREDWE